MPEEFRYKKITDKDVEMFFENSEQGKHKDKILRHGIDGFNSLLQGKRWRGIHIHEMYEPGVLSGDVPYFTLLGGYCGKKRNWLMRLFKDSYKHEPVPRTVVNFLKKEMFQGIDAEIIEKTYQDIINS